MVETVEPSTGTPTDHALLQMFATTVATTTDASGVTSSASTTAERFSVGATGAVSVFAGGLQIMNPVSYNASGPAAARADPEFGGLRVAGGVLVHDYGVRVENGGLTVVNDPRGAGGAFPGDPVAGAAQPAIFAEARDPDFSNAVLSAQYSGVATDATQFDLLRLRTNGAPMFTVDGTGFTHVRSGGLRVETGGATIVNGGLEVVNSGVVVDNGGVNVRAGGLVVDSGSGVISVNSQNFGALTDS